MMRRRHVAGPGAGMPEVRSHVASQNRHGTAQEVHPLRRLLPHLLQPPLLRPDTFPEGHNAHLPEVRLHVVIPRDEDHHPVSFLQDQEPRSSPAGPTRSAAPTAGARPAALRACTTLALAALNFSETFSRAIISISSRVSRAISRWMRASTSTRITVARSSSTARNGRGTVTS